MDDATRARWRDVQEGYAAALKLARAAWPAESPPGIVQAAAATMLEAFDRRSAPVLSAVTSQNGSAPAVVVPPCPECGGPMDRVNKTNPKQPDFRCRDRQCDKALWTDRKRGRSVG